MHIAWIHETAAPVGGSERYVRDTAALLAQHTGARSTLLYSVDSWTEPSFVAGFHAAFPVVDIRLQLAEIAPDIVFAHRMPTAWLRQLAAARLPRVGFIHDHRLFCLREHKYTAIARTTCTRPLGMHCYPCGGFVVREHGRLRLRRLDHVRAEQTLMHGFDAFVVASRYMASHLAAHGFDSHRTVVAPLYVQSVEPTASSGPDAIRRADLLVFAGQLVTGKGLDVLLDAMPRLRYPAELAVLGDGAQRAVLEARSRALGLGPRVRFHGRVAPARVHALMRRAACAVVPSRAPETFGLVGPEAMMAGAPVVATSVGGTREWLDPERTGLAVPPNDAAALAHAIDRVLGDRALAANLARCGQELVRSRLTPERHAQALMGVFDTVAGQRRTIA